MNAVIYARYSSAGQTEQSIEGQLHEAYAYAQKNGITIVGEYIDRAFSGRIDGRPDFLRMMADAKKRQFEIVLVYKLDRFSRNRYDSVIYKNKLSQYGVRVVSVMENITPTAEGAFLEALLEAQAQFFSDTLSTNVLRGMTESAKKGHWCGGGIPYGYSVVNHHLIINEKEAPHIKYVFEQYAAGVPKKKIIEALNQKGIRSRNGKPFGMTAFQGALSSPIYKGVYSWRGIESPCPALIDTITWDTVQERLKQNRRTPGAAKAKVEYLLQGKLFCGYCKEKMTGLSGTARNGEKHYYYACVGRRLHKNCKKKHEKKDFLEWYVVEQTLQYVLQEDRLDRIAQKILEQYEKEFGRSEIEELERHIRRLNKEIDTLMDRMLQTDNPALLNKWQERLEGLVALEQDSQHELSKLRVINQVQYTKEQLIAWLKHFCNGDLFDMDFRRKIIKSLVSAVYLYDDKIYIFYSTSDQGKQVNYFEELDNAEFNEIIFDKGEGLYFNANGTPEKPLNRAVFSYPYIRHFQQKLRSDYILTTKGKNREAILVIKNRANTPFFINQTARWAAYPSPQVVFASASGAFPTFAV